MEEYRLNQQSKLFVKELFSPLLYRSHIKYRRIIYSLNMPIKFLLLCYGGVAQWVARLTRDRWIPISRDLEPHQRPPLFH